VIGRKEIMGLYAPGSMTSTHSASPLGRGGGESNNLQIIKKDKLVERAARSSAIILCPELQPHPDKSTRGCLVLPGARVWSPEFKVVRWGHASPFREAQKINVACFQKGFC